MPTWNAEKLLGRLTSEPQRTAFRLACQVVPRVVAAVLPIEVARLGPARIPRIFSNQLQPLDPLLNEDLLMLYGRSEQVLANRFAFLNRPQTFDEGIDWEPAESQAWLAELHAFDYALDLALTHRISGEEKYARHLRYVIAHWIAENPPFQSPGWSLDALARRVRNWILAADLARTAWETESEFRRVAGESLAFQCLYLHSSLPGRLDDLSAFDFIRALLLASRVFSGGRTSEFRETAFALLASAVTARAHQDGAWAGSGPALRLGLAATLLDWLIADPGSPESHFIVGSLREVLDDVEAYLLPDGNLSLVGHATREDLGSVAALAAALLMEPKWKSVAANFGILPYLLLGEEGRRRFHSLPNAAPEPACAGKPDHRPFGRAGCFRLSGAVGSALLISSGHPNARGGHADHLSFELVIRGQRIIVDGGVYAPEGEPEEEYFAAASAHNLLLINRKSPDYSSAAGRVEAPEGWVAATRHAGVRMEDAGYASLGVLHTRAWFRLSSLGWLIVDRLDGGRPRDVTCLLHFYPTFQIQLGPDRALVRSRAETVTVIPIGTSIATMQASRGDQGKFPGWYAPRPGLKYPSSVLALKWSSPTLPWVGAQLIVPGDHPDLTARLIAVHAERIELEIAGERLLLPA